MSSAFAILAKKKQNTNDVEAQVASNNLELKLTADPVRNVQLPNVEEPQPDATSSMEALPAPSPTRPKEQEDLAERPKSPVFEAQVATISQGLGLISEPVKDAERLPEIEPPPPYSASNGAEMSTENREDRQSQTEKQRQPRRHRCELMTTGWAERRTKMKLFLIILLLPLPVVPAINAVLFWVDITQNADKYDEDGNLNSLHGMAWVTTGWTALLIVGPILGILGMLCKVQALLYMLPCILRLFAALYLCVAGQVIFYVVLTGTNSFLLFAFFNLIMGIWTVKAWLLTQRVHITNLDICRECY